MSPREKALEDALREAKKLTDDMTSALGPYPFINRTGLVAEAYRVGALLQAALTTKAPAGDGEGKP